VDRGRDHRRQRQSIAAYFLLLHVSRLNPIASYTVDVDHLAIGKSGTEKILSVLDAVAAEASGLIPLYRAGIELTTRLGAKAGPPARVPDASRESPMALVCETVAHPDRWC